MDERKGGKRTTESKRTEGVGGRRGSDASVVERAFMGRGDCFCGAFTRESKGRARARLRVQTANAPREQVALIHVAALTEHHTLLDETSSSTSTKLDKRHQERRLNASAEEARRIPLDAQDCSETGGLVCGSIALYLDITS